MVSDDADGGGLFGPVLSMQRSIVRGGLEFQRQVAENVLEGIESLEDISRRTRLSSHYTAVRAVDRLEDAHPDDEASLDPVYEGVGQTFETVAEADGRATAIASDAVETTTEVTEGLGERYLEVSETTCDPFVDRIRDPLPDDESGMTYQRAASDD